MQHGVVRYGECGEWWRRGVVQYGVVLCSVA